MSDAFRSEMWQRFWFNPETEKAEWSRAESTTDSLCKVFAERGIMTGKVLDLCCGTGRLSAWLAKRGFTAVGLDISSLYLEEARNRAREHGVEPKVKFLLGDMRDVDKVAGPEGPFDCVLSFRNSFGFWGDETDEMIFAKVRRMTKKGGVLVIGECDHLAQLMLSFDRTRVYESEDATMISEANMDYISNMFQATFRYYTKEGGALKYRESFNYQARVYSVSELSSLLGRVGWKVIEAYESLEDLQPFTHRAIFKGTTSMNVVAKAT